MEPIKLTTEEIKKLTYGLKSLDQNQRAAVSEVLVKLAHSADARISEDELRRELSKLKADHQISDFDAKAVMQAVFK